jgi:hypothetical protein
LLARQAVDHMSAKKPFEKKLCSSRKLDIDLARTEVSARRRNEIRLVRFPESVHHP